MTDFLKRVSQTALGLAPVVQPLVVSRYAQAAHRPAPEALSPQESLPENPAQQAHESLAENLSPAPPSSTISIVNRAPEQATAHDARHESAELSSQESAITKPAISASTQSTSTQSDGIGQSAAMPFNDAASQTRAPLNRRDLPSPSKSKTVSPTKEAQAHSSTSVAESEQSPSHTVHEGSTVVPVVARHDIKTAEARNPSPRRRDAATSPVRTSQDETIFGAAESTPLALENERSSQAMPVVDVEPTIRRDSSAESFAQSSGAEPRIEALETSAPAMPRRNNSPLLNEPATRRADSQLLAPDEDRAASTSTGRVVRVTIGRIEVRAVMPSPPPQPVEAPAPPAPNLSLDEFLRQHNGRMR